MSVQTRLDIGNVAFIRSGTPYVRETETILKDVGRTTDLAPYTVMGYDVSASKWVPLATIAGTSWVGERIPTGIYVGNTIAFADIVAADVVDCPILVGGCCTVDENQVVLEGSLNLDDTIVFMDQSIRFVLGDKGIYCEDTVDIDGYEN